MRRDSTFLKLSPIPLLALIAALALQSSASGALAANLQSTMAATMAGTAATFPMCMPPTPTPTATGATPAATEAAPAATTMPTMAATTMPTVAATMAAPTATKVPSKTPVPSATPSATPLVKGQKPVTALIVVGGDPSMILNGQHCLKVSAVTAGGPAAIAGIKKGDYILALDNTPVATAPDFFAKLDKHVSGDTVSITVQRGSSEVTVQVTLGVVPT